MTFTCRGLCPQSNPLVSWQRLPVCEQLREQLTHRAALHQDSQSPAASLTAPAEGRRHLHPTHQVLFTPEFIRGHSTCQQVLWGVSLAILSSLTPTTLNLKPANRWYYICSYIPSAVANTEGTVGVDGGVAGREGAALIPFWRQIGGMGRCGAVLTYGDRRRGGIGLINIRRADRPRAALRPRRNYPSTYRWYPLSVALVLSNVIPSPSWDTPNKEVAPRAAQSAWPLSLMTLKAYYTTAGEQLILGLLMSRFRQAMTVAIRRAPREGLKCLPGQMCTSHITHMRGKPLRIKNYRQYKGFDKTRAQSDVLSGNEMRHVFRTTLFMVPFPWHHHAIWNWPPCFRAAPVQRRHNWKGKMGWHSWGRI